MVDANKNAYSEIHILHLSQPQKHEERYSATAKLIRSTPARSGAKEARGCEVFLDTTYF